MHWTPWMRVAFAYFRRTYPEPFLGNAAAEKLLAFLLGMASHQTADVSWHALGGLSDGFMNAIADLGPDSIEKVWLEFPLEKSLEF